MNIKRLRWQQTVSDLQAKENYLGLGRKSDEDVWF